MKQKLAFIDEHRSCCSVALLCRALHVSRSAYYAYKNRKPGKRDRDNAELLRALIRTRQKYPAMGLDSLFHFLRPGFGASRARIHRQAQHPFQPPRSLQAHDELQPFPPHLAQPAATEFRCPPSQPGMGGRHRLHPARRGMAVSCNCQGSLHEEGGRPCLLLPHRCGSCLQGDAACALPSGAR